MSRVNNWADDDEGDIPATQVTQNKDGTQTVVSYTIDQNGRKVKRTQRLKRVVLKDVVLPNVAERTKWTKFGDEEGSPAGPQASSTAIADNISFQLALPKKIIEKVDEPAIESKVAVSVKCRICFGPHWTSRCQFKDSMLPEGDNVAEGDESAAVPKTGAYVPVNRRPGGAGPDTSGGKYERDDSLTLRVTNINDSVEEQDLRDLFTKCAVGKDGRSLGRVTRVFLARDKITNRLKGFAFISFDTRSAAQAACEKLDGYGFHHLILKVDFPKPAAP